MNWIDSLFGKQEISKEATVTPVGSNASETADRKIESSGWMLDLAKVDADQVEKDYLSNLEAEAKILGKTAAYESYETQEETLKRDYKRDVSILSDYALAEILMDLRGTKDQNLPEKYVEIKEKAKADVKSSRAKCEKEVLEHVGMSAQVDWKKAFEKYTKEAKPEEPKEADLFQPKLDKIDEKEWSTGKKDDKDFVISDKEKTTQAGAGNGREADERTDVTKQPGEPQEKKASLNKESDVVKDELKAALAECISELQQYVGYFRGEQASKDTQEVINNAQVILSRNASLKQASIKVDAFLVRDPDTELTVGSKITLARSIMSKEGTILEAGGDYEITATEGERYIITANGKSYTACRFDTPKFFRTAAIGKKADYEGWKNSETWQVALWLDNDQALNAASAEMAQTATDPNQLAESLKNLVEEAKPDLGASLWDDMINWALAEVDWMEIAGHFSSKFAESSKKENISKEADKVKDSPANDKGNQALPESKETAGDKPEEAVDGTTLPTDKKEVGDKADRAEEKNSYDKGEKVETVEAVNKKAHNGTDHVAEMCPVCSGPGRDLGSLGSRDHFKCEACGIMFSHDAKTASCGHCSSLNTEIKNQATKEDIFKLVKTAEVNSPWRVITDEKTGQEMIARVEDVIPTNKKESEENKEIELQK